MGLLRHWVATGRGRITPPTVVTDEAEVARLRDLGWTVEGPFVPAEQLQGAVEALRQAEEDRDALRTEVALCHAALIDAGQRLDRLQGGQ